MNDRRRNQLRESLGLLNQAYEIISSALDQEENCLDNTPEAFQSSEKYIAMEDGVEIMTNVVMQIDEITGLLEGVIS